MSLTLNIDATEPRLLPELCVADNVMAVSNFLEKEKEEKEEKEKEKEKENGTMKVDKVCQILKDKTA